MDWIEQTNTETLDSNQTTWFESLVYTPISDFTREETDVSDYLVWLYQTIWEKLEAPRYIFEQFLESKLWDFWIDETQIIAAAFTQWNFEIYLQNWEKHIFSVQDFTDYRISESLQWEKIEDIETKVSWLLWAIDLIYNDNDWFFSDGEIDENDRVGSWEYQWKTLWELKDELDIEKIKLYNVYSITWDSHKQQELLRREIEMFAWVWWVYEWWARMFSLSDSDMTSYVGLMIQDMNIDKIFNTIIWFNEKINSNWRASDLVDSSNMKLMNAFYIQTYEKLISNESPNSDFIRFAEIITWRATTLSNIKDRKWNVRWTKERKISFDNAMASYDIASKALLYVMNRPDWVLETIQNSKKDFEFWDPELKDKNPTTILNTFYSQVQKLQPDNPKFWEDLIYKAKFESLVWTQKSYNELSYDEKIQLWALYRIWNYIASQDISEWNQEIILGEYIHQTSQEAFLAIQSDFDDSFDGMNLNLWIAHPNFFGEDSKSLWLTGDFGQIFDLYQDINGNMWFFDLHDSNEDWFQTPGNVATLGTSIIAWAILFSIAAPSALALAWIWAALWAVTWITSVLTSSKWYDTRKEALIDSSLQIIYEIVSSAAFMYILWKILVAKGHVKNWNLDYNPDLFFSRDAWTARWMTDKTIMIIEILTWMIWWWFLTSVDRKNFSENHFDSETTSYRDLRQNNNL